MNPQELIKLVITTTIAYFLTRILDRITKGKQKPVERQGSFPWGSWIVFHGIGGGIGGAVSGAMGTVVLAGAGNWAVLGASIGIMQWIILNRYIHLSSWWVVGSTLGWACYEVVGGHFGWIFAGALVGIFQWFSLRGKVKQAAAWIAVNVIAWLPAGLVGIVVGAALLSSTKNLPISWMIGWFTVGIVGGTIVGIALAGTIPKQIIASENG